MSCTTKLFLIVSIRMTITIGSCFLILSFIGLSAAFAPVHLTTYNSFQRHSLNLFSSALNMAVTKEDLLGARDKIDQILDEKNCGPIFVRLAWHDSGEPVNS